MLFTKLSEWLIGTDPEALNFLAGAVHSMFQQWYPNLTTHTSQCGHYPMQEVPVEFARVVQSILISHS